MPGTSIGRYVIRERLAEGGMAEIFLASARGEEGFSKDVVIKVIRPALGADPQFVSMFIAEARLASRLNHANIVHIFDFGKHEDRHYLAMEYVRGASLAALRARCREVGRPFPPTLAAEVAAQVARGLHHAHGLSERGERLGIVHRDVSPHNILLSCDGAVKLTDFGIAKAASSHTTVGMLKGKFAYMAPEQSRGDPVDARTDVFALGIVLWELLTAGRLFGGASDVGVLKAVQESFIAPPARLNSEVPAELSDLVMRALARPREERFQTAEEFDRALSAFVLRAARSPDDFSVARFLGEVFPAASARDEHDAPTGEREGPLDEELSSGPTHHVDRGARPGPPRSTITHTPSAARTSRATPLRRGASGQRVQSSHDDDRGAGEHERTTIPLERLDDGSEAPDDEALAGRVGDVPGRVRRPRTALMPQLAAAPSARRAHAPSRRAARYPVPRPSKALAQAERAAASSTVPPMRPSRMAVALGAVLTLGVAGLSGRLLWPGERAPSRPDEALAPPAMAQEPSPPAPTTPRETTASAPTQPMPERERADAEAPSPMKPARAKTRTTPATTSTTQPAMPSRRLAVPREPSPPASLAASSAEAPPSAPSRAEPTAQMEAAGPPSPSPAQPDAARSPASSWRPGRVAFEGRLLTEAETTRYWAARDRDLSQAEAMRVALGKPRSAEPEQRGASERRGREAPPPPASAVPAVAGRPANLPKRVAINGKLLSVEETDQYYRAKYGSSPPEERATVP